MKRNGEKQWNVSMKGCCKRVVGDTLGRRRFEQFEKYMGFKKCTRKFKRQLGMRLMFFFVVVHVA